jgi:hypothetical protein
MARMTDRLRLADDYHELPCGCEMGTVDAAFVFRPHAEDCTWYAYVQGELAAQAKPIVALEDVPAQQCADCGVRNDAYCGANTAERPTAGAISICAYCAHLAMFTGDGLQVRELTDDELADIEADPEVHAAQMRVRSFDGWAGR